MEFSIIEYITLLEEYIQAIIRNELSDTIEDAVDLAKKRAALVLYLEAESKAGRP